MNVGGGGGEAYVYLDRGATKFPEDNRARNAALAQQGYARIAAENAAKAEAKAAKQAAKAARRTSAAWRSTAGDGESTRELLDDGASGMMGGAKEGRKRGLLAGWRKKGDGEAEVVR